MNARRVIAVFFIISMLFLYVIHQYHKAAGFPDLRGPYLGQQTPGDSAVVFAPDIVSTGMYTRDLAMTPDGKEIYFCVVVGNHELATIFQTREVNGQWTEPEVAPFATHPDYRYLEPAISPDGQHFFFVSNQPNSRTGKTEASDFDIWVMERTSDGWGDPQNLGVPVNTDGDEFFPSVTRSGTLYLTRDDPSGKSAIFRSQQNADGSYQMPGKLGPVVNHATSQFNAFVAPNESYLIVPMFGLANSYGATDYYICFRDSLDNWTGPFNLGPSVNSRSGLEYSPYVSPDGDYFFFMSPKPTKTLSQKRGALYPLTKEKIWKHFLSPDNGNPNICWISAKLLSRIKQETENH